MDQAIDHHGLANGAPGCLKSVLTDSVDLKFRLLCDQVKIFWGQLKDILECILRNKIHLYLYVLSINGDLVLG